MHRVLEAEELVDGVLELLDVLDAVELELVDAVDDALSAPELQAVAMMATVKRPTERARDVRTRQGYVGSEWRRGMAVSPVGVLWDKMVTWLRLGPYLKGGDQWTPMSSQSSR